MTKPKLKTVLKMSIESRTFITVKTEGKYKTYLIDVLAKKRGVTYDSDGMMECDSAAYLPKEVLDRTVTYIGINNAYQALAIDCY